MSEIRLGVWNMEWLNDLFTSTAGQVIFKPDGTRVRSCRDQGRLALRRAALVAHLAMRRHRGAHRHRPLDALEAASGAINQASDPFDFDSDDDGLPERRKFERRSRWWALAGAKRMKLLAPCRRLREVSPDAYLTDPATREVPLGVCGDINDRPGFDTSEMRLKASAVETLMGSVWRPSLCLGNALFDGLPLKDQHALDFAELATTRFADPIFNDTFHKVWIDHALYSRNGHGAWIRDGQVHARIGSQAIWRAFPFGSDHYPVSATIAL